MSPTVSPVCNCELLLSEFQGIGGAMADEDQLLRSMQVVTATVVNLLVRREYDVLESMTEGRFLSAAVLEQTVRRSNQTLVELPVSAYADLRPVQEPGASPPAFRISLPMWTEGRAVSDLTLELRLIETYPALVDNEILSLSQRAGRRDANP